jgi:hypothetical protein
MTGSVRIAHPLVQAAGGEPPAAPTTRDPGLAHTQTDVAARIGTPIDTVQRVEREAKVTETDDSAERRARGVSRPSTTTSFAAQVVGVALLRARRPLDAPRSLFRK